MGHSGKLYYHGTADEVQVGDRIRVHRFLRSPLCGTVCYVPGQVPTHPEMNIGDGLESWAIRLDDGELIGWAYLPNELQPRKAIELIARDFPGAKPLSPEEEFH